MELDSIYQELKQVKSGKANLVEAIHKLDIVIKSMAELQDIRTQQEVLHQNQIAMKSQLDGQISAGTLESLFNMHMTEFKTRWMLTLDQYRTQMETLLEYKVDYKEFDEKLEDKVNRNEYNKLASYLYETRTLLDINLTSTFEAFKSNILNKLDAKADIKLVEHLGHKKVDMNDFTNLEQRTSVIEEVFEEEETDEEEDEKSLNFDNSLLRPFMGVVRQTMSSQQKEEQLQISISSAESVQPAKKLALSPWPTSPTPDLESSQLAIDRSQRASQNSIMTTGKTRFSQRYNGKINRATQRALKDYGKMIKRLKHDFEFVINENQKFIGKAEHEFKNIQKLEKDLYASTKKMDELTSATKGILEFKSLLNASERNMTEQTMSVQELAKSLVQKMGNISADNRKTNENRAKRLLNLEGVIDTCTKETLLLKSTHTSKLNEIIKALRTLTEFKQMQRKQIHAIQQKLGKVETEYKEDVTGIVQYVNDLGGPLIDYIKDSKKQNDALESHIKRTWHDSYDQSDIISKPRSWTPQSVKNKESSLSLYGLRTALTPTSLYLPKFENIMEAHEPKLGMDPIGVKFKRRNRKLVLK